MNIRTLLVAASPRPSQGLLLLLLALAGCGSNPIQKLRDSMPELPGISPLRPNSSLPTIAPPQMGAGGKAVISEGFIDQFFQKRQVSGEELLFELVAIRQAAGKLKSGAGLMDLLGAQDAASRPATNDSNAVMAEIQTAAMRAALSALESQLDKMVKSGGSAQELDQYLGSLLEAKQALAEEKIELPSGSGLNAQQKRRLVTMAAMLVAMRLSNKQLDQARKDFAGIENDYLQLIERREQAAGLLYELLQQKQAGSSTASQAAGFSRADQDFLAQRSSSLSLKEFSNDMGVQNLALRLLRQRDPALYADYRAGVDRSSKRTQAYVRSMVGGAAFGSLASAFGRQLLNLYKDKKNEEMLAAAPLVLAYGNEVRRGLGLSWDVTAQGIFPDLGKSMRAARFRLSQGEQTLELASAAEVMAELDKGEGGKLLREALFRDHALGLIYRVYLCDRAEAGRMLDRTMPAERRDLAARSYLNQPELQGFSFAASFSGRPDSARELELGDKLLRRDHRRLSDDSGGALAQIQRSVTERSRELSNDQLLRLIFANREGSAMRASLDLGRVSLRAMPSMQAVYAYEAQVDGCRSSVAATAGEEAPSPPTPPKPPKPRDKVEQSRQDNKSNSQAPQGAKPSPGAQAQAASPAQAGNGGASN